VHIALLCATRRGRLVLEKLIGLQPEADLTVFSFREDPWEPPFCDEIKGITLAHGGRFIETRQVGSRENMPFWEIARVDIAFAVSWRYMIPPAVYQRPRLGTYVFHDSLLPAYRGFSPTVWAMVNGEDHTGVTLFEVAEEVDAGDIVDQERVPIGPDETISVVMARVTAAYLQVFERNLAGLLEGSVVAKPQDHAKATFTCKRLPEDNKIDWGKSTEEIYNLIRAVSQPYPGAYTYLGGERLRVWSAKLVDAPEYVGRIPGRVVQVLPGEGTVVMTGDGALLLMQVQRDGGDAQSADEVLDRISLTVGGRRFPKP
jgi:methionyl-tRNA formyltransferase